MCLEDKFLIALYTYHGPAKISEIADYLSITDNALLSIINRVTTNHPQFVILQKGQGDKLSIAPDKSIEEEVMFFLEDGGFTAINEQELREYYQNEMEQLKGIEKIKQLVNEYAWIKWVTGVVFTIAGSFSIAGIIKIIKNNRLRKESSKELSATRVLN